MSEKVLWTNPNPTSDFVAQSVTLSEALSDFDYVGITFKGTKSNNVVATTIMRVSEFKTIKNSSTVGAFRTAMSAGSYTAQDFTFTRRYYYVDDTHLYLTACNIVNYNATTNNSLCIPTQVIGLK